MKHIFTHIEGIPEDFEGTYNTKITYECFEVSLPELLTNFENYLRACGFVFDGHLDIVNDEIGAQVEND